MEVGVEDAGLSDNMRRKSLNNASSYLKIFDYLPAPTVVLSQESDVVLSNKACHRLAEKAELWTGQHVSMLPLRWQDGPHNDFMALLASSGVTAFARDYTDNLSEGLKLQVEIIGSNELVATLLVSAFHDNAASYRILSFENIRPLRIPLFRNESAKSTRTLQSKRRPPWAGSLVSYSGTRSSNGEDDLRDQFARLRDAIYDNEERAGFLLSADNTFCYPNYKGSATVQPVEIDDVEMFFANWNAWDQHFTSKMPFADYPSIRLNREKKKFRNFRMGLKEAGKDIVIEVSGDPLYHKLTGKFLGGVCWVAHLGEYADVMAADLKAGLTDFRNICERLPHMLWTVDTNGHCDYFSESWYEYTGLTREESIGLNFQNVVVPEDMEAIWKDFHRASLLKIDVNREARYRCRDGQWRWMTVRARPLLDSSGNILKWYGTSTDVHDLVTERLHAETKQHQLMEMLSLTNIGLFDVSPEGQVAVHEGKVGWTTNGNSCYLKDMNNDDGSGVKRLKDAVHSVALGNQDSISFEGPIRNRWYKFRLLRDGEHGVIHPELKKVIGCSIDITEHRERAALEAENARLVNEATLEIEKGKLKTAFLAHMSHEIRTPIAGIIGLADMVADTLLDEEQKDCIENLRLSANNLLTIVNDILDLSKIEAGELHFEKVQFDLHSIMQQTKKLFLPAARSKGIDLYYKGVSESISILGDPGRVKQILNNLVSNALKFTSKGSICFCIEKQPATIRILVCDTGDGIDEEMMSKLFRPFTQGDASTARRHGGTGLGLTISRNLAHGMGGTLELRSKVGEGTRAILTLPVLTGLTTIPSEDPSPNGHKSIELPVRHSPAQQPTEKVQQATGSEDMSISAKPLVFVVDDNPVNTKIALALVRKLGYETCSAWNGKEALDFLEKTTKPPACILMDCQMPILDGYETVRRLRNDDRYSRFKKIPVVALTASAIQGDREKCQASGMDDYLSKPVNKGLLGSMLKKWVPGQPDSGT